MAAKKEKKIKITQTKSRIGYNVKQKLTLDALGLRRMNQSVVKTVTPQIEGMVKKIQHLISVEEV
ncbi:MAG TPA: 50S ribosomal protein L30 [Caldithrix abyssi]|uniref:50S ribosomal protein L30 n=1 Tax=Caldithrix abyssi TaxID=187145 RepID=A0A7V4U3K0_CALAY|nr:50S ribosomal protein L30 [Caldithrix abyssi]